MKFGFDWSCGFKQDGYGPGSALQTRIYPGNHDLNGVCFPHFIKYASMFGLRFSSASEYCLEKI